MFTADVLKNHAANLTPLGRNNLPNHVSEDHRWLRSWGFNQLFSQTADKLLREGGEKYFLLAMDMAKVGGPYRLRSFPHEFEHPNVHSLLSFSQF